MLNKISYVVMFGMFGFIGLNVIAVIITVIKFH